MGVILENKISENWICQKTSAKKVVHPILFFKWEPILERFRSFLSSVDFEDLALCVLFTKYNNFVGVCSIFAKNLATQ